MKRVPVILVFHILTVSSTSQSDIKGNPSTFWNDYPACERQCHQDIYGNESCTLQNDCACTGGCLCLNDDCLCTTSSWLTAVSQCVEEQCGSSAVTEAASIASSGCGSHGFTLAVSPQSLIQEGPAASSTSPSAQSSEPTVTQTQPTISESQASTTAQNQATSTTGASPTTSSQTSVDLSPTATVTPSDTTAASSGGLDTSDKIAIGIGVPVGLATILGAWITWKLYKKRNEK